MKRPADFLRLVDVARYLRVTKQRAHQLAAEDGFPVSVTTLQGVRVWKRGQIEAWANRKWWGSIPWRK